MSISAYNMPRIEIVCFNDGMFSYDVDYFHLQSFEVSGLLSSFNILSERLKAGLQRVTE